jgi:Tol biopolymer transport system component
VIRHPASIRLRLGTLPALVLLLAACGAPMTGSPADVTPSAPTTGAPTAAPATPSPTPEPTPVDHSAGTGPWIVYQGGFLGGVDLGLVRPDGSDAHRIPGAPADRWHPDWSPDGTMIAYDGGLRDREAISVLALDGSDERVLLGCDAPCVGLGGVAWTPDGTRIGFYHVSEGGPCYLGLLDVATGEVTRVLEQAECEFLETFMRFSPDGRRIVFQREHGYGNMALFTATIDGQDVQQLTAFGLGARPDWSPDGEWIVFQDVEPETHGFPPVSIHRIRADGTGLEQLSDPEDDSKFLYPRWLPDGSGILYSRCITLATCETRVMDPDGSNDRLLFEELGNQTVHIIWQPGQER